MVKAVEENRTCLPSKECTPKDELGEIVGSLGTVKIACLTKSDTIIINAGENTKGKEPS